MKIVVVRFFTFVLAASLLVPMGVSGQIAPQSTATKSVRSGAATMSASYVDVARVISDQLQPCANRQSNPGPGAERIRVTVRLHLNRDGSLAEPPVLGEHSGVDDTNRRYLQDVDKGAIATVTGCQPFRGLPPELYDVRNGWSVFSLRYKLPG